MRCVIDNNVLISSATHGGLPLLALERVLTTGRLLTSVKAIRELSEVLGRDKFEKYLPKAERVEFVAYVIKVSSSIEILEAIKVCRDPKDNMLLEVAGNGGADFLITGDGDLLELDLFRSVRIINPREFVEILNSLEQS
ncbi:MAG: putative toxin-antitoxin system toxin component, PIN family [Pyrinomonadaceae bacterium]